MDPPSSGYGGGGAAVAEAGEALRRCSFCSGERAWWPQPLEGMRMGSIYGVERERIEMETIWSICHCRCEERESSREIMLVRALY
jgi:hypothetical protein